MKKIKKILLIVVILVVVLGIAGVIVAGLCLDKILKTGIETVAPTITQTTVTVDGVNLSLLSGSAAIKGLVVGNPDGYKTTNAISIGKAAVSVTPGSLLADKLVVRSIEIIAPQITFEGNPFGDNNLQKILNNVSGPPQTNAPATAKKAGKKLEVDDFVISGAKITAHVVGLEGEPFTVVIPDIHFTSLGTGPDGITAADLTKKVLTEITSASLKIVTERATALMGKTANNLMKGATDTADKAVNKGTYQFKKGIGNLLGK